MSRNKVWLIFVLFFILSFSFINFNFEHKSYTKENEKLSLIIKDFLEQQVHESQLFDRIPYYWAGEIMYNVAFNGKDSSQKDKKKEIDLYLNELSEITGLKLKEVKASDANVRFLFSDDWREDLLVHHIEFKDARERTKDMDKEDYQAYWMKNKQDHYVFRGWHSDRKQFVNATLFFNYNIKEESCQISTNTARILMLPPNQVKSYINSCRYGHLPLLEGAFLKVYYSDSYKKFLKDQFKPEREKIIQFFLDGMLNYIHNQ